MKIEIKNRLTGDIIFEYDQENNTIKKTVEKALKEKINLSGCNLFRANLTGCYLSDCDLSRADLSDCYLSDCNLSGAVLSD